MKLKSLLNSQAWERHAAISRKRLLQLIRTKCESRPLFVLGKQRSGTSMIMAAFHRHPQMLVYDEHRKNPAFVRYRLRSFEDIQQLIDRSRFPIVCMKPVSDSHRINDIYEAFPNGHYLWLYRDYRDVANSSLRKFESATRAIRLVCTNEPGGGWFQEGVSPAAAAVLQSVYTPSLSDFDLACLAWWARNQVIFESGLIGNSQVTLLQYEALVSDRALILPWLFSRIGCSYPTRVGRKMSTRSIGRYPPEPSNSHVSELCLNLMADLDSAYRDQDPPSTVTSQSRQGASK